jgi:mRNA-degrading endonuclease RelE of RelBE toxin-antitoxin system
MKGHRILLTPAVAEAVTHLSPDIKKLIRAALNEIARRPSAGKELQEELTGFLAFKTKRYRIIYTVDPPPRETIRVHAVGHRREVYELFSELMRRKNSE